MEAAYDNKYSKTTSDDYHLTPFSLLELLGLVLFLAYYHLSKGSFGRVYKEVLNKVYE